MKKLVTVLTTAAFVVSLAAPMATFAQMAPTATTTPAAGTMMVKKHVMKKHVMMKRVVMKKKVVVKKHVMKKHVMKKAMSQAAPTSTN